MSKNTRLQCMCNEKKRFFSKVDPNKILMSYRTIYAWAHMKCDQTRNYHTWHFTDPYIQTKARLDTQ